MGAEIGHPILQIHRALTARAYPFAQVRPGFVIRHLRAPLTGGQSFCLTLTLQIALQRHNGPAPYQHGNHYAHGIAHVAAITGQIGHQLDKEGKQRKEDKAPDKGPPRAFALFHKQPASKRQQRQGDGQAVQKHAQLLGTLCLVKSLARIALHLTERVADTLRLLAGVEQDLLLILQLLLGFALYRAQLLQFLRAANNVGVLLTALCGRACSNPAVEVIARGLRVTARLLPLQLRLIPCLNGFALNGM